MMPDPRFPIARAAYRRLLTIAALATVPLVVIALLMTACAGVQPTSAEPGDGPAAAESSVSVEGEPSSAEPSEEGDPEPVGAFTEKVVYEDGVEFEFTKIKTGKVTARQAEYYEDQMKAGDVYALFTLRVRNGSKQRLDLFTFLDISYGPDGEEAEQAFNSQIAETGLPDGILLPGKAKSGTGLFLIPAKDHDDVVAEVQVDYEHATAVFSGSIKK